MEDANVIRDAASTYNGDNYEKLLVWQAPLLIDYNPGQHWCPWMENYAFFLVILPQDKLCVNQLMIQTRAKEDDGNED